MKKFKKDIGSILLMATTALSPLTLPKQVKAQQPSSNSININDTQVSHAQATKGTSFFNYVKSLDGYLTAQTEIMFLKLPKSSRMEFYNQSYFSGNFEGYFTIGMLGLMLADTINDGISNNNNKNQLESALEILDEYLGNREILSELSNNISMNDMKKHLKGKDYNEYLSEFADVVERDVRSHFVGDTDLSELAMYHNAGYAVLLTQTLPENLKNSMKVIHSITSAEELGELCINQPLSLEAEISMLELPEAERYKFYKLANSLDVKEGVYTPKMYVMAAADTLKDVINHQDDMEKLSKVLFMLEKYQTMISIDQKELSAGNVKNIEKHLNEEKFIDVATNVSNFIKMQVQDELTESNIVELLPKFKKDFPILKRILHKKLYPNLDILLEFKKQNFSKDIMKDSFILKGTERSRG